MYMDISQDMRRMEIKGCVFVVACFAKLLKLHVFKKYFPRCHAVLTNFGLGVGCNFPNFAQASHVVHCIQQEPNQL